LAEFGVKWTPPVAWLGAQPLILALFWHEQHTYALNTTQPHVFLPPKHHQYTSIMLQIDIGC